MKRTLKIISVFLAFVMILTCFSAGFTGLAASTDIGTLVNLLRGTAGEYTRQTDLYTLESETDGWNNDANYVGYAQTVTAKDNSIGNIANAAAALYSVVDTTIANDTAKNYNNLNLLRKHITELLEEKMSDEHRLIRVDTTGERYVAVKYVTCEEEDVYMEWNSTKRLTVACTDEDHIADCSYDTLDWWSSNPSICMVDENGRIYTRGVNGDVTITATSVDNPTAKVAIYVHVANTLEEEEIAAPLDDIPTEFVKHSKENVYDADGNVAIEGYAPELYATEFEYYNVETVVKYMLGGCSTINSANWFDTFTFICQTDYETALFDNVGEDTKIWGLAYAPDILITTTKYAWPSHVRTYDASGTKATYSLSKTGYRKTISSYYDTDTLPQLYDIYSYFSSTGIFNADYSIKTNYNCTLLVTSGYDGSKHYDTIDDLLDNFNLISNEFAVKLFGNSLYTIMATANMIRPNYTYTDYNSDGSYNDETGQVSGVNSTLQARHVEGLNQKYYLWREVNEDPDGTTNDYWASTEDMDAIVHNIDQLLHLNFTDIAEATDEERETTDALAGILSMFINSDSLGIDGYANVSEMILKLLQSKLYTDDIVNLIVDKLYPVLGNVYKMVDELIDSKLFDDVLAEGLRDLGLYFASPSHPLEMWYEGYLSEFPDVVSYLKSCSWVYEDGDDDKDIIGLSRDISECHWHINGDRGRFVDALCAALSPLSWILYGICNPSEDKSIDGSVSFFTLKIYGANLYGGLLVPLFEALGIDESDGLLTPSAFMSACRADDHDDEGGAYHCLALRNILNPILNWVENKVIYNPIEIVCALLPNLSYFIQSGNLKTAAQNVRVRVTVAGIDASFIGSLWSGLEEYVGPFDGDYFNIWGLLSQGALKDTKVGCAEIWKLIDPTSEITLTTVAGEHKISGGCVNAVIQALLAETFSSKKFLGTYDEFGNPEYEMVWDSEYENADGSTGAYVAAEYSVPLPTLCDKKLQECGVATSYTSVNGLATSRVTCNHPGLVLVFLFRYIFYSIGYNVPTDDWSSPTLLECFLSVSQLKGELFLGLSIDSLISNIVLNPEAAILAIVELFISNEGLLNDEAHGPDVHDTPHQNYYGLAYPDYQYDAIMEAKETYEKTNGNTDNFCYGAPVRYTQYWTRDMANEVIEDIEPLADSVLAMLKLDSLDDIEILGGSYSLSNGINAFIQDLVSGVLFNNEMLSTIADAIYGLLSGLSGDIDIATILSYGFDINFDINSLIDALYYKTVTEQAEKQGITASNSVRSAVVDQLIKDSVSGEGFNDYTFYEKVPVLDEAGNPTYETEILRNADGEAILDSNGNVQYVQVLDDYGQPIQVFEKGAARDWGYNNSNFVGEGSQLNWDDQGLFIASLTAILAPAAELLRILMMGKDLSILGLVTIDMYEIYYYTLIPLFEALGATNIIQYETVAKDCTDTTPIPSYMSQVYGVDSYVTEGNLKMLEYFVSPIAGLLNVIMDDPITWIFSTIPNLMYFLLIGAFNDAVNNLLHFAYVLLDILKPILNAYDLVPGLVKMLGLDEYGIALSLPLDLDINGVINNLLDTFLDLDSITGGGLSFELLGADLHLALPSLDLSILCTGIPEPMGTAAVGEKVITLNGGSGGDLITVILELVLDVVFMEENWKNIAAWLRDSQELDNFDYETEYDLLLGLNKLANDYEAPDKVLYVLYILISKLTGLSGTLADRFKLVDFGIIDLFQFDGDDALSGFIAKIKQLLGGDDDDDTNSENSPVVAAGGFIQRLMDFFKRIGAFFRSLFGGKAEA